MAEHSDAEADEKQERAAATLHQLITDIDEHPNDYRPYYDLSAFLIQLKSYTQAEELLMKALGLFADRSQKAKNTLTYGLGNVYYAAGEYTKAIQQFQQVTDSSLKQDAYIMLGQSYYGEKNYGKALAFLITAHDQAKQDPELNRLIGDCLLASGDLNSAADFYRQTLNADPDDAAAHFNLGVIELSNGHRDQSEPEFEKSRQLDENYFMTHRERIADIEKVLRKQQKE
ncbi:tetratricopeptide repeat protein [Fructilactobacillus cliffordii]|uniref:Tetratricopeptide repeat protein n=1 Tax=Fructilactobacillus cliffordii TaxID=2940299 RepID=A0A9Q8ZTT8_9LACO|nr:tetratricopeptide repeat protein [Fructilactobacillus cliffordii]USS89474.1 tetratricopeptide repeat protein [Fructilactobacillus cliffordii]